MKTSSFIYTNEENFKEFLNKENIQEHNTLLQIFSGVNEEEFLKELISIIKKYLPKIKIIGSTTAGEIHGEKSLNKSVVLSFSIFEKTQVKTALLENTNDSFQMGIDILSCFCKEDLQNSNVAISFLSGSSINAEEYLHGINIYHDDIVIAGGLSADNYEFSKTFVFNQNKISKDAVVIALLINKDLEVFKSYNFNWKTISKKHIIEKSHKNRVFQIGGKTAVDFYRYHLGEDITALLPRISLEFPFIIKKGDMDVSRVVLNAHDDGSLSFAGNMEKGSEIKLGYGNIPMILQDTSKNLKFIDNQNIESLFVYSCSARKELLHKYVSYELKPYAKLVSNITGFFTNGEFFNTGTSNEMLNHTMTILGLSEGSNKIEIKKEQLEEKIEIDLNKYDFYKSQGLSQLISVTTKELEDLNATLEQKVEKQVYNLRQKDALIESNSRLTQMGEILTMIIHQYRQPLNSLSLGLSTLKFYKQNNLLTDETFFKTLDQLSTNVEHLNTTIEDFRDFFNNNENKTRIKPKDLISKTMIITKALISKVALDVNVDINFNDEIEIHPSKMLQVLLNLFKNSFDEFEKTRPLDARIDIKIYKDDEYCIFQLEDNAGGIKEEHLSKLFDKGFSTKLDNKGTGIGLFMTKTIVEKHLNGSISAKNGKSGAIFTIKVKI